MLAALAAGIGEALGVTEGLLSAGGGLLNNVLGGVLGGDKPDSPLEVNARYLKKKWAYTEANLIPDEKLAAEEAQAYGAGFAAAAAGEMLVIGGLAGALIILAAYKGKRSR